MKKYIIGMGLMITGLLLACSENDRPVFDTGEAMLNLWFGSIQTEEATDSVVYNYAYRPYGTDLDSVMFYVRLAGIPKQQDCTFELEPVAESVPEIIAGTHYLLPKYTLKAGTTGGFYPIYLKNTTDFKDKSFTLTLALKQQMDLKAGAKEYAALRLVLKDRQEKPPYWDDDPVTYQPLKNFFGVYSAKKYQFIIKATGIAISRVYFSGTPTPPNEVSYNEALYLKAKCQSALQEYNNNPENPDRPLTDENGPINF